MQQFDQAAAGGATQLDGTTGKGLFDAVNKAYPRGGEIHGLYVRLGAGGNKSVTLQITPKGAATIILDQVTAIIAGVTSYVLENIEIVFGPDDVLQVITTNATGPLFASLFVDDEVNDE